MQKQRFCSSLNARFDSMHEAHLSFGPRMNRTRQPCLAESHSVSLHIKLGIKTHYVGVGTGTQLYLTVLHMLI